MNIPLLVALEDQNVLSRCLTPAATDSSSEDPYASIKLLQPCPLEPFCCGQLACAFASASCIDFQRRLVHACNAHVSDPKDFALQFIFESDGGWEEKALCFNTCPETSDVMFCSFDGLTDRLCAE